jgi:alpha-tubulin suppressor-like RCC1 family protein
VTTRGLLLTGVLLGGCNVPLEVLTRADAGHALLTGVTDLSAGATHSCAVSGGRLACWGDNGAGELGRPVSEPKLPGWLDVATDWARVRAGEQATCATKLDGSLWCWGFADAGQLGRGTFESSPVPQRVELPAAVTSFDLKFKTACAVLDGGLAACWGANGEGQVGLEDVPFQPDQPAPRVLRQAGWLQLCTGQGHSCGVGLDGSLWCWGRNTEDQLGLGPAFGGQQRTLSRVGTDRDWAEVSCGISTTCARKRSGELWCWGQQRGWVGSNVPSLVEGAADWRSVSIHVFNRGGLRAGGVWSSWGRNIEGQLGVGDFEAHDVAPLSAGVGFSLLSIGRFHACGAKDGAVFCTGDNPDGELGTGTGRVSVPTPVLAP